MEKAHEKILKSIRASIETLLAVETLDYHDKNLLSGDNKTRSEWKQDELKHLIFNINKQLDILEPM